MKRKPRLSQPRLRQGTLLRIQSTRSQLAPWSCFPQRPQLRFEAGGRGLGGRTPICLWEWELLRQPSGLAWALTGTFEWVGSSAQPDLARRAASAGLPGAASRPARGWAEWLFPFLLVHTRGLLCEAWTC